MKSASMRRTIKRSRVMRQYFAVNLSFWTRLLLLVTGKIYFKYAVFVDDPGEFINIHSACSIHKDFLFKIDGEETIETETGFELNEN